MKTNENSRPPGGVPAVVVESKLTPRLTKEKIIALFEAEISKRDEVIRDLKIENREQERELRRSQALNRERFAIIEELRARINIGKSETAQMRLIDSLDRQLEMSRNEADYYKNLARPVKWVINGLFFYKAKTGFEQFCISLN